jgi:diaminopropionate ammonia-lyase
LVPEQPSGKLTLASGNADTVMGGLACREISPVTWPVVGEATTGS